MKGKLCLGGQLSSVITLLFGFIAMTSETFAIQWLMANKKNADILMVFSDYTPCKK